MKDQETGTQGQCVICLCTPGHWAMRPEEHMCYNDTDPFSVPVLSLLSVHIYLYVLIAKWKLPECPAVHWSLHWWKRSAGLSLQSGCSQGRSCDRPQSFPQHLTPPCLPVSQLESGCQPLLNEQQHDLCPVQGVRSTYSNSDVQALFSESFSGRRRVPVFCGGGVIFCYHTLRGGTFRFLVLICF